MVKEEVVDVQNGILVMKKNKRMAYAAPQFRLEITESFIFNFSLLLNFSLLFLRVPTWYYHYTRGRGGGTRVNTGVITGLRIRWAPGLVNKFCGLC